MATKFIFVTLLLLIIIISNERVDGSSEIETKMAVGTQKIQFQKLYRRRPLIYLLIPSTNKMLALLETPSSHHRPLLHKWMLPLDCFLQLLPTIILHFPPPQHYSSAPSAHQHRFSHLYDSPPSLSTDSRSKPKEPSVTTDLALHELQSKRLGNSDQPAVHNQLLTSLLTSQIHSFSLHLQNRSHACINRRILLGHPYL